MMPRDVNLSDSCTPDRCSFSSVAYLELHTEKSYQIKPKSDCIYHAPIDLKANGHCPFAVPSQSENGN